MPLSVIASEVITEIFIGISCTVCSRLLAVTIISSMPCEKDDVEMKIMAKINVIFLMCYLFILM